MASGNVGTNAGPVLSSFSANLRQHLTELTLKLGSARHRKEDHLGLLGDLGVLNMLTALQKLEAGDLDLCSPPMPRFVKAEGCCEATKPGLFAYVNIGPWCPCPVMPQAGKAAIHSDEVFAHRGEGSCP